MRVLRVIPLSLLLSATTASADPSRIVDDRMPADYLSVNVGHDIPLKIYLPEDHSPSGQPYRVYIYLHGAFGHGYTTYLYTMKPVLDDLIGSGAIAPLVVVWPDVQWPGVPDPQGYLESFGNYHCYTNSSRNGDYDSAISTDLLGWLKDPQQHALPYNLSVSPCEYAVGGFSMGAGGAICMAARHHQEFAAVVGQSGILSYQYIAQFGLPLLLSEYPGGPPYPWDPSVGYFSNQWFAWSSAYSPNPTGNLPLWGLDFPVDAQTGEWIPEILDDIWIDLNDSIELYRPLKMPGEEPGEYVLPIGLYFDARNGEINRQVCDVFNAELIAEGVVDYVYNVWPGGSHALLADAVDASLRFIDQAMDDALSAVNEGEPSGPQRTGLLEAQANPFRSGTAVRFRLSIPGSIRLSVLDIEARLVRTLMDGEVSAGRHAVAWDGCDGEGRAMPSGTYMARLETGRDAQVQRLVLLR